MRKPIGVFDSGIGGLTVVKSLMRALPSESIVYLGDTARVPYGTKSKSTIERFSVESVEFLLRHDVKCIVIACNTASAYALGTLRRYFKVPIIGVIHPGAMAAVNVTRSKRIGVVGTKATVNSKAYEAAIRHIDGKVSVYSQSCPLFVPFVEEGWISGKTCEEMVRKYLNPLKRRRIDTLILGCTHYPLLARMIQRVVGKSVRLIDSAKQTAEDVQGLLTGMDMLCSNKVKPKYRFFVTDEPKHFNTLSRRFLGKPIARVERARWER